MARKKKEMEVALSDEELRSRAVLAAKVYMIRYGFDVVAEFYDASETDVALLAYNEEAECFAAVVVSASQDLMPSEMPGDEARSILESSFPLIVPYIGGEHVRVRLDHVCVQVMGDNRAMLKHHIDSTAATETRKPRLQWLAENYPEAILAAFGENQRRWLMEEVHLREMGKLTLGSIDEMLGAA